MRPLISAVGAGFEVVPVDVLATGELEGRELTVTDELVKARPPDPEHDAGLVHSVSEPLDHDGLALGPAGFFCTLHQSRPLTRGPQHDLVVGGEPVNAVEELGEFPHS
jgi:hypothetical protein